MEIRISDATATRLEKLCYFLGEEEEDVITAWIHKAYKYAIKEDDFIFKNLKLDVEYYIKTAEVDQAIKSQIKKSETEIQMKHPFSDEDVYIPQITYTNPYANTELILEQRVEGLPSRIHFFFPTEKFPNGEIITKRMNQIGKIEYDGNTPYVDFDEFLCNFIDKELLKGEIE